MKTTLWLAICLLTCLNSTRAQAGFYLTDGQKQVDIPFEYTNSFIILTIHFNGVFPLKFIFDTGAEHTILSKREISDLLKIQYEKEFHITGSDLTTDLVAYLARNIRFDIPGKVTASNEDILVLQEDYFRFEEYAGVDVHGILSANIFSRYIVKINYPKRVLTLYDRSAYKLKESGYAGIPLEIYRNKPYLNTATQVLPDSVVKVKLLVDTGAGLPMLLFSNTHPLLAPPPGSIVSNIGMGLGGYLEGFVGRVHQVTLESFSEFGVVTYFQTLDSTQNLEYLNNRNGLVGNVILSRFYVILDYRSAMMWLKPTKEYRQKYEYDRSGLLLISGGAGSKKILVQNVLAGSPAADVGIQRGDELIRVRRVPAGMMTLQDVQRVLQKSPGKKVKILLRRDGKKLKKEIVLKDLL